MTGWTSNDFLLQWIWVAIIVACAIFLCVRNFVKPSKRGRNGLDAACDDCPVRDNCNKLPSNCDVKSKEADEKSTSCGCK